MTTLDESEEVVPGRTPPWARGEPPNIAEKANAKMRRENAAERLHIRGVGHLPLDPAAAAFELTEEQRALRSSRPNNRRWKALDKHDAEIARLTQKRGDAHARLHEAEEALRQAPEHDAQTLAAWIAAGEKRRRPAATVYERERDRDAARLLVEAVTMELDEALRRRKQHIEDNRETMIQDATGELDDAVGKLRAQSQALAALRQAALEARDVVLWIAAFPEDSESYGFATATALGLREPVERVLNTKAQVEFAALLEVLEEDAIAIRSSFGPETARALGIAAPRTPLVEAQWDVDVDPAWKAAQLERARGLLEWSPSPSAVADEAADFRP
ncbi:hypothetical protein BH18ACT13_BH18ACT13_03020 [soil metagenome]